MLGIAALGAGGFGVYKYMQKKEEKLPLAKPPLRPVLPIRPIIRPPIRPIYPIPAKPEIKPPHFEDLASKVTKEDVGASAFDKLQKLTKPMSAEKHEKVEQEIAGKPDVFERLRKVAWQGLTSADRKDLLLKLKLFEQGKLTKEQIGALFKKLRITADYFTKNKERLENELEEYVAGKPAKALKKTARKSARTSKPARKK